MSVLVTGAAGFIGFHVSKALLDRGEHVVGVDNLNPYYDPRLKKARLELLAPHRGFSFYREDVADREAMQRLAGWEKDVDRIVHLAAQAGVRYSLENPWAYVDANVHGQITMMEIGRSLPRLRHLVYASSSSVYGGNTKLPFAVGDPVDQPVSTYAATKRAGELLAETYAHLYHLPMTGLRFFTVYGPWGRPDMAYYNFVEAIMSGHPIKVFNHGRMRRDFTYIDDIVRGVLSALDRPPACNGPTDRPHKIYNLGNHRAEELDTFISVLEDCLGEHAERVYLPMQAGDVKATYADIASTRRDLGFSPETSIEEGIPRFVEWYRGFRNRNRA